MSKAEIPKELAPGAKCDRTIERFAIYTPIGLSVGLALSFLFRRRWVRASVVGLTTGIAMGSAWGDAKWDFDHPMLLHGRRLSSNRDAQ